MSRNQSIQGFNLSRTIRKYFVSGFVVVTFVAYALHDRSANANGVASASAPKAQPTASTHQVTVTPRPSPTATKLVFATPQVASTAAAKPTDVPTAVPQPTDTPTTEPPTAVASGQYKDGTYTGPQVDVFYGLVQVQATVKNGQLADVQFLQYPTDRRTSQRINSIAVPDLQQEALQAQSANVNIISGATLTSEGFAMSLDNALASAHN
jgi:uncharacterized protein with FMN-binding domain